MTTQLPSLLFVTCLAAASGTLLAQNQGQVERTAKPTVPVAADGTAPFGAFQDDSGRVHADGGRYRAEFTPAGVELATPPQSDDSGEPTLHLRLLSAQRAGNFIHADQSTTPDLAEHFVRYQRDGFVEAYEVKARGYEQSFHFDAKPSGFGDLVFEIEVSGNVTAAATKTTRQQALEFRLGDSPAIRYGEAWAFGRGGERVAVKTSYDGSGRIELTVPASFVETAAYPIVVDPVVGPVLDPSGASYIDTNPDVAYGENGHYMVVWQRTFTSTDRRIRGVVYDRDGNQVGGLKLITSASDGFCQEPAIAFGGVNAPIPNSFFVVYESPTPFGEVGIAGRMYQSNGQAALPSIQFSSPQQGEADHRPDVAPGINTWIVAWDRTSNGAFMPNRIMMTNLSLTPAMTGYVNGGERWLTSASSGYVTGVKLAQNSTHYLTTNYSQHRAVWTRFWTTPAPGDSDIRTCSFRLANSTPVNFMMMSGPTGVGESPIGVDAVTPDIAARASSTLDPQDLQYCVVWEREGDVKARMFDQTSATGSEFAVRATPNVWEGSPAIGAGFDEFTVAYGEIIPPAEFTVDVYAARVQLDGTVPVNHRPVDVLGGPYQDGICVSSRPIQPATVLDPTNTALIAWSGGTSTTPDIRARFWEPVAPYVMPYGSPCAGPLGELPRIGTAGGSPIVGNQQFRITLTDAPASSVAVLLISGTFGSAPLPGAPGCTLYVGLPLVSTMVAVTDPIGDADLTLPMPSQILSGTQLAFQWAIISPTANSLGLILSDDVDVSWYQ
jgi:hypothetical protein